jgi:hypothetical protein
MKLFILFISIVFLPLIIGCSDQIDDSIEANQNIQYSIIEWTDLMPEEDLNALLNPPNYVVDADEGSLEDQVTRGLERAMLTEEDDAYQRALISEKVVAEFNGKAIKLAGFVVPLDFNDEGIVTEFFFVPYFGACIHLPAPPPNQIIFVKHKEGLTLDEFYNPIWISGILTTSLIEDEVATSAYTLDMKYFEPYAESE